MRGVAYSVADNPFSRPRHQQNPKVSQEGGGVLFERPPMTPDPPRNGNGITHELPTGQLDKLLYLVRAVGVPVAVCGVVIWHGWGVQTTLREERKEHDTYARETLMGANTKTVEALTVTTRAVEDSTKQGERLEIAIDAQVETNVAVIEAVEKLDECMNELNAHNRIVP